MMAGEHFERRGDVAHVGALHDTQAPVPKTTKPHLLFSLKLRYHMILHASSARTSLAPSTMACIFPKAEARGKYFKPQSGATIIRSALTCAKARRMRAATVSGVSMTGVERSSTPTMIVFPGNFSRIEQSSDDCAVSMEI